MLQYIRIIFTLSVLFLTITSHKTFSGLICKQIFSKYFKDNCGECTRNPNNYYKCEKIIMERVDNLAYNFICYTKEDLELGEGPTKIQSIVLPDRYENIHLFCDTSIDQDEIIFYIQKDECRTQRVRQYDDCDWFDSCLESDYNCGKQGLASRYRESCKTMLKSASLVSAGAQRFSKSFSVCFKNYIAAVYDKLNSTCDEIESIAYKAFPNCFKESDLCGMLENTKDYSQFFINYYDSLNKGDTMIQRLLNSVMNEAKFCGQKAHKQLQRYWQGLDDDSIKFLLDE
jgi:hypothetical protein